MKSRCCSRYCSRKTESPPSRGAWIEILRSPWLAWAWPSPPSRGAWIEIVACVLFLCMLFLVAPLAGGVD